MGELPLPLLLVDNQDTLLWHSELMNFPAIITPVGWVTEATSTSRVQPQCSSLHLKPSWLQGPPHFILTDQPCSGLDGSSTEILNVSKIRTEKKIPFVHDFLRFWMQNRNCSILWMVSCDRIPIRYLL